jgi:uncharacterized membrane protein YfhO
MQAILFNEPFNDDLPKISSLKLAETTLSLPIYDKISVTESNAHLIFSFAGGAPGETYIRMHNFRFLSGGVKSNLIGFIYSNMKIQTFSIRSDKSPLISGIDDFIFTLGIDLYGKDIKNSIGLNFGDPGIFSLGSIEMIFLPMGDDYIKQVEALKEDHLENVEEFTNGIRGTANLKSSKIMVFSIPYSKGWTAFVNGKKTKLLRANTMFMALPLKAGFYNIELRYFTPGLKVGIILSILGFLFFGWICRLERKKLTKEKDPSV